MKQNINRIKKITLNKQTLFNDFSIYRFNCDFSSYKKNKESLKKIKLFYSQNLEKIEAIYFPSFYNKTQSNIIEYAYFLTLKDTTLNPIPDLSYNLATNCPDYIVLNLFLNRYNNLLSIEHSKTYRFSNSLIIIINRDEKHKQRITLQFKFDENLNFNCNVKTFTELNYLLKKYESNFREYEKILKLSKYQETIDGKNMELCYDSNSKQKKYVLRNAIPNTKNEVTAFEITYQDQKNKMYYYICISKYLNLLDKYFFIEWDSLEMERFDKTDFIKNEVDKNIVKIIEKEKINVISSQFIKNNEDIPFIIKEKFLSKEVFVYSDKINEEMMNLVPLDDVDKNNKNSISTQIHNNNIKTYKIVQHIQKDNFSPQYKKNKLKPDPILNNSICRLIIKRCNSLNKIDYFDWEKYQNVFNGKQYTFYTKTTQIKEKNQKEIYYHKMIVNSKNGEILSVKLFDQNPQNDKYYRLLTNERETENVFIIADNFDNCLKITNTTNFITPEYKYIEKWFDSEKIKKGKKLKLCWGEIENLLSEILDSPADILNIKDKIYKDTSLDSNIPINKVKEKLSKDNNLKLEQLCLEKYDAEITDHSRTGDIRDEINPGTKGLLYQKDYYTVSPQLNLTPKFSKNILLKKKEVMNGKDIWDEIKYLIPADIFRYKQLSSLPFPFYHLFEFIEREILISEK